MNATLQNILVKSIGFFKKPKGLIVLFAAFLLFLWVFRFLPYRERSSYCCSTCLSRQDEFQWRIGSWGSGCLSFPLSGKRKVLKASFTYQNFVKSNHQHEWIFAQRSPYYFGFKWGGCALGRGGRLGQVADFYEMDEDFRTFLAKEAGQRKLGNQQVLDLLLLPRYPDPDLTNNPAFKENLKISDAIMKEYLGK
jgi:hypothetical protein